MRSMTLTMLFLLIPGAAEAVPAAKSTSLAAKIVAAVAAARIEESGGRQTLYGLPINGSDTDGGRLACARVVAAVLRKAGAVLPAQTTGVVQVESGLSSWRHVASEADLLAGDVVIYRHLTNRKGDCSGGGTCHVVISAGGSRVFGNSSYDIPLFAKRGPQTHDRVWLTLAGYRFKAAYRAP